MDRSKGIEVLLVEDSPGDIRLTQEALREAEMVRRLSVATDGVQALEFLRRQGQHKEAPRPDLILLDLNLPKKSGSEVLAEIKNDVELRQIPVVILTTSADEHDIHRAYDLHANCYITKPVDFDQFIAAVRSIEQFWLAFVQLPR